MARVRVNILLKNRDALIKKVDPKHTHFKFRDGLYILSQKGIQNYMVDGRILGSELFVFEGNPNPVTVDGLEDKSKDYLNEITAINVMKQTSLGPRFSIGTLFDNLSFLKNPINWFWLFTAGVIAYGLITGGGI